MNRCALALHEILSNITVTKNEKNRKSGFSYPWMKRNFTALHSTVYIYSYSTHIERKN